MSDEETALTVVSGVSAFTGEGFVVMRFGRESGQMTPEECRQQGLALIEAADAADFDAAFVRFVQHDLNLSIEKAASFLGDLREWREENPRDQL